MLPYSCPSSLSLLSNCLQIDSVLMTHYLVGNGLTVDYLGENSPFPTALSLMWNNSAYDITVDAVSAA